MFDCHFNKETSKQPKEFTTDPFNIAIETEEIEDPICIHLHWVQSMQHDYWGFSRRRGKTFVTRPVSPPTTSSYWRTDTATFIGYRRVLIAMVTIA